MLSDAKRSRSLGRRIAVTFGVPLALLAADRIPAPGIDAEIAASLDSAALGVLALGIAPALSAYLVVEAAALSIPRFRRLRHGGPAARLKLERAATVLAVVLAALQAFGMVMYLAGLELEQPGLLVEPMARWSIWASVCAGACATLLAARWISRQGLANGFILISVFATGGELTRSMLRAEGVTALGRLDAREIGIATASLLVPAAATALALSMPLASARGRPLVPVPSSSGQPFLIGVGILTAPAAIANLFPDAGPSLARWGAGRLALLCLATFASALLLAWAFQQPRRVASTLTGAGAPPLEPEEVSQAQRRALLPTLFFLAALVLCQIALERLPRELPVQASAALLLGVLLVPVIGDLAGALKQQQRHADLVPVWEERRPYLLPYLRQRFAEQGISFVTLHERQQNLFRFFAPYVAAEIWVPANARERARTLLEGYLLGAANEAAAPLEAPTSARAEPAAREGLQLPLLAGLTIAALGLALVAPLRTASIPTVKLEIVRVDDGFDPFATGGELPEGVSIESELVGRGEQASSVRYLVLAPRAGESAGAALERVRPWIRSLKLPPGTRLAFGALDAEVRRSYVLAGDPVVTTADVTRATAAEEQSSAVIRITLNADAADRLARVTRQHVHERLAVLLDDEVEVAPVVLGEIAGGELSISLGTEDPGAAFERAETIARALQP